MSAHTPGPWIFRPSGDHQWIVSLDGEYCFDVEGNYMRVSGLCKEADARLMAAAPELLEALEMVRNYGSASWDDHLIGAVDAALAKAAGVPA